MRAFANRENAGVIREVAAATEGPLDAICVTQTSIKV